MSKLKIPKRQSVAIHSDVVETFQRACKAKPVGRSMNDAATRILAWFSRQEPLVQTAVMSDVDRGMEPYYAIALRRLANELEGKPVEPPFPEKGDPFHQQKAVLSKPAQAPARDAKGKKDATKPD